MTHKTHSFLIENDWYKGPEKVGHSNGYVMIRKDHPLSDWEKDQFYAGQPFLDYKGKEITFWKHISNKKIFVKGIEIPEEFIGGTIIGFDTHLDSKATELDCNKYLKELEDALRNYSVPEGKQVIKPSMVELYGGIE